MSIAPLSSRKWVRRGLIGSVGLLALLAGSVWVAYRASQAVPDFYERALRCDVQQATQAGDELEEQVLQLHNEVQRGEDWEFQFTDNQVNGWLISDLPTKFPGLMPEEVQNPRVVFQDGRALIACRIQTSRVKTVLSLALEAHLTDQPNEIAIRVAKVRAGLLPVPMKEILEKVSQAATAANISLRWTQSDGDPVALVQFPDDLDDVRPGVRLKTIAIEPGQLSVGGSATPAGDTPHP